MLMNQVALVTGASRGIGRAIAYALGNQKAVVIGTATSEAGAQKISDGFKKNGITGSGMVLNVTDAESIKACLKQVNEVYSPPDILVNNAGVTRDNLLIAMKDQQWDEIINTNFYVCFLPLVYTHASFSFIL